MGKVIPIERPEPRYFLTDPSTGISYSVGRTHLDGLADGLRLITEDDFPAIRAIIKSWLEMME